MRIGLRLPQYGSDWDTLVHVAARAARGGAAHLWVNDHLQSPGRRKAEPTWEAFTTLAALAVSVPDVRLGVAVASASYRPAALTAKMATVTDVIAGGRVILGLGTGSDRAEHAAYGVPFGTPGERTAGLRGALEVVQAMQRDPDGAHVPGVLEGAPNRPAALTPGGVPVWVAAHGPVVQRLAGRLADGVVIAWVGPEALAESVARTRAAADAAGRPSPTVALYTFCLVVPSRAEALAWLRPEAEALGSTPESVLRWAEARGVVGPPDEVRDRMREREAAGAAAPATLRDTSARHNLVHLLVERHREAGHGGAPAVEDDEGVWSYDDLAAALRRAAGTLAASGVRGGDRVGVALRDGRPWCAAFLGAAALGAVPVPVDPASPADAVALILDDCEPAVVVAEEDAPAGAHRRIAPEALLDGPPVPVRAVHPDDLAYLIYSSGSTGRPKGVMHAHRDLATTVEGYAREVLGLDRGDRCHSVARLFTSLGFGNGFSRPLGRGATAVMTAARPTPRATLAVVERMGVTVLTGVPTSWAQLAAFLERHPEQGALSGVRLGVSSGDRLPETVRRRLRELTGLALIDGLGCSECSNVVISTRPGDERDGVLGEAVPGVDIDLRDPEGRPVADGEPGRLWIRSDSNTTGYWRRIAVTRDLVHGEWLRMGDVLVRQGGVYRHVGRADDMFKVDARWVSPGEVEASLLEVPEVAEAAVAGVPDAAGLMRVHAWVVAAGGTAPDTKALRRHVAHALAPHMAPREVTVLEALPRLPSGKVDRRSLRAGAEG